MTKQLITKVFLQSLNIGHKDADVLARIVLTELREELERTGELRLPGIGSWSVVDGPKRIGKPRIVKAITETGIVNNEEGAVIANAVLDLLEKEVIENQACIVLPSVGELMSAGANTGKKIVRFRPSPHLKVKGADESEPIEALGKAA